MARAGERRRRTGRSAAVGASVVLHGAALLWLAWWTVPPRPATTTPEPPVLLLRLGAPRSDTPAPAAAAPSASAPARAERPAAVKASAPALDALARPTTRPTAAPPSSGAVVGAGALGAGAGEAAPTGVRDALRGLLGCAHAGALDLSPAEKARCAERLGLASRTAPHVDRIPAEKRAYYDAVEAAYAETHFYGTPSPWVGTRPNLPVKSPFDDWREGVPPGHTANIGCSPLLLLPGYKPRPHSLKLGPCVITPPRGTFTEEADIPDPPTLREREADAAHMKRLDPPAAAPPAVSPPPG